MFVLEFRYLLFALVLNQFFGHIQYLVQTLIHYYQVLITIKYSSRTANTKKNMCYFFTYFYILKQEILVHQKNVDTRFHVH